MNGAKLDAILAKSMQLAGAAVLFAARHPIRYQPGCGVGRPQFGERVLLIHPKDSDHLGTWVLPDSDIAPEEFLDSAVPFGDVLLTRCDVEFEPALDENKFEHCWTNPEFAVSCAGNHPDATAAIKQFLADSGNSTGAKEMESRSAFIDAQAKAERVAHLYGDSAPAPLNGECLQDYRVRLVSQFQKHSRIFKDANLARIGDAATLTGVENQIYADAAAALNDPSTFRPGELRAVVSMDGANRPITKYIGDPNACWSQFNPPIRYITKFMTSGRA